MLEIPRTAEKLRRLALESGRPVATSSEGVVTPRAMNTRPAADKKKKRGPTLSFILMVIVPIVLSVLYYVFVASDQYAATAQFAIRGADSQASGDILGLVTGFSSTASSTSDSHMVVQYIQSREMVEKLDKSIGLRKLYTDRGADFWAAADKDWPIEKFVDYWNSMVHVYFDSFSGITELEVKAFTPEDAELISKHVISLSERLVNDISMRARDDAVREARSEVSRAENRLRMARNAVATFREKSKLLDPAAAASADQQIVAKLEQQVSELRAQLGALGSMADTAPRVVHTKNQIAALEKQIEFERTKVALAESSSGDSLTKQLKTYEDLQTEQGFAEKAYVSTLASLERARVDADRQQRYLAVFVQPSIPEDARYPERLHWIIVIALGSFVIWGIGSLTLAGIRDHIV